MGQITIEGQTGKVSDGFHTFDELYDHRSHLYVALMLSHPEISWRALKHNDGSQFDGWFIAGMRLPTGDITYHLKIHFWLWLNDSGIETRELGPEWDGHASEDVLKRIKDWCSSKVVPNS